MAKKKAEAPVSEAAAPVEGQHELIEYGRKLFPLAKGVTVFATGTERVVFLVDGRPVKVPLPVRLQESEQLLEGWEQTENEIRHRLKDPAQFDTCRRKDITKGIATIFCRKKDDGSWHAQALRFDKNVFSLPQAKKWVADHPDAFKEAYTPDDAHETCEPVQLSEATPVALGAEAAELVASSADEGGDVWEVTVLAFGKSKRPPHYVYTREAAQQSVDRFNGAKVYANTSADDYGHKKSNEKVPKDAVGVLTDARVTESDLRANLHILPSGAWLKKNLNYVASKKLPMPYELSIDATGFVHAGDFQGEKLPIVQSFDRVSVDVVERGAAGGKILRMVASDNSTGGYIMDTKAKLLALFTLLYPTFLESKKVELPKVNENELYTYLLEADKPQDRLHLPDGFTAEIVDKKLTEVRESLVAPKKADPPKADDTAAKMVEGVQKQLAQMQKQARETMLVSMLEASKLPSLLQGQVKEMFTAREAYEAGDVEKAIKGVREVWSKVVAEKHSNAGLDINIGLMESDKVKLGIEGFFMLDPNRPRPESGEQLKELKASLKGVDPFRSFKEAYVHFTGDKDITGRHTETRFSESLQTTDWANVLAATLNRRMVRDYGMLQLDTWREFVDIVPVTNFKQQERVRYGGYPNLPVRPQGDPYAALASPTDEKATYTPTTKGGTEDITREMIINDDVSAISKIPARMARAAAQTLHEFVYNFVYPNVNPNIYTGTALYLAGQSNIGSAALAADGVALAAARLRMKKFPMKDNSKRLGIRARYILVPSDLEAIAYGLVTPASGVYNNVPTFLQRQSLVPIVVDYWTDATDWALVADRSDVVGLEVGFLNGQETPETFVSDIPNVGAWFTNDKMTFKIRHEYGAAIIDWRAFDGSIVA